MISPVTSTSVATNGAEDVAGSRPNLRNTNGNIEPANVPHITTPISAKKIVNPIKGQCGPYTFEKSAHNEIRTKPSVPRMPPNASPEKASRRITRHQSRKVTSLIAIARMIKVVAWEPELPPLEMINGRKSDNTTAFSISCWKKPMAVVVSISLRNKITSHGARLLIISSTWICKYGPPNASIPPIFWMSSVASCSATSSTSSTVTTPTRTSLESSTGKMVRSYFLNAATAVSWSSVARRANTW